MKKFVEKMRKEWRENRLEFLHRTLAILMTLAMVVSVMPQIRGEAGANTTVKFYQSNFYQKPLSESNLVRSGKAKDIYQKDVSWFPGANYPSNTIGWYVHNGNMDTSQTCKTDAEVRQANKDGAIYTYNGSSYYRWVTTAIRHRPISYIELVVKHPNASGNDVYKRFRSQATLNRVDWNNWKLYFNYDFGTSSADWVVPGMKYLWNAEETTMEYRIYVASDDTYMSAGDTLIKSSGKGACPIKFSGVHHVSAKPEKQSFVGAFPSNIYTNVYIEIYAYVVYASNVHLNYHVNNSKYTGTDGKKVRGPYLDDGATKATVEPFNLFGIPYYECIGWNTKADGTGTAYSPGTQIQMTKEINLYAQWRRSAFQVIYNANGADVGTAPVDSTHYHPQGLYNCPTDFTVKDNGNGLKKAHRKFNGWNTKANGTGTHYEVGDTLPFPSGLTDDLVLYAQWEPADEYYLEYAPGNHGTGSLTKETLYDDGIATSASASIKAPGTGITSATHTFLEWELDDAAKTKYQPGDTYTTPFDKTKPAETVTARWGAALTYDKDAPDALAGAPADSTIYDYENNQLPVIKDRLPSLKRPKFIFSGWDTTSGKDDNAAGQYQPGDTINASDFTQNTTLYAHWKHADEYNVTYELNPPTGLSDSDMVGALPADSTIYYNDELNDTVTVKTNTMKLPHYRFDRWKDVDTGKTYLPGKSFQIEAAHNKNIRLEAQWAPAQPYEVTYDANLPAGETLAAGSAPVDTKSPYYNDLINDTVTVLDDNGMERAGCRFTGWNTEKNGSGTAYQPGDTFSVVTYGVDVTLYAQWQKGLTITGLNPADKEYDGTADWNGTVTAAGVERGDQVFVAYTKGAYHHVDAALTDKDVESGKGIEISGISLSGADAAKYYIVGADPSAGTYDAATKTYTATGSITKRKITISPTAGVSAVIEGNNVPAFTYQVSGGTLAAGDKADAATFGNPVYKCEMIKSDGTTETLTPGSPANVVGVYTLSVSGLANPNYDITFQDSALRVDPIGSTPVRVTYKEGNHGLGTPPVDANTYYIFPADPSRNSQVVTLAQGGLYSPGCRFLGWNTNPNGTDTMTKADGTTTNLLKAGDTFVIQSDTTLYAVWQGDTVLEITGISPLSRPYDGTTNWSGKIDFKKPAGEEVDITYTTASYDTKDAGQNKTITLSGIKLTGKDAYKYKLASKGMYDQASDTITVKSGEITPLPITVKADMTPAALTEGDSVPNISSNDLSLSAASPNTLVGGENLATDFGTPVFTIQDAAGNVLTPGSPAGSAGIYNLTVSGLNHPNYVISYESTTVTVTSPSRGTPVQVTYHANGASGLVPLDGNTYYVAPDPANSDIVTVLAPDGGSGTAVVPAPGTTPGTLTMNGCKFTGWNTKSDGSGITIKADGASTDRLQAGDMFAVTGATDLYAMWEPDNELTIKGLSQTSKEYDNSDVWNGQIALDGVNPGDDVKIEWDNGQFDGKDVGNHTITAQNLRLSGTDAYKYRLVSDTAGLYDAATKSLTYPNGEITKRPVTIEAVITSPNPATAGGNAPTYDYQLAAGSFAPGEDKNTLDSSAVTYTLVDKNGSPINFGDIKEAGSYYVKVSGLSADNYDISYSDQLLRVADEEKTPAYVTYYAPDATGGSVPKDTTEYMVYKDPAVQKPQAEILPPGDLERSGYAFAGWKEKDSGKILQPGQKIAVSGMVHLEAVWKGDTKVTITDLTNKEKTYDGTDKWSGEPKVEGLIPGDDVKIEYQNGKYAAKDTGERAIRIDSIVLTGTDAAKYVLVDSDIYDTATGIAETQGRINPLKLEIIPVVQGFAADAAVIKQGEEIPPYELYLPSTSRIIAPDQLSDFGTPVYSCKNYKGEELVKGGAPGYYRLSVSGLSHNNYELEAKSSIVALWAPGMKPAKVTYRGNGGEGAAPIDNNLYATFDDPSLNSMVTVMKNTFTKTGYKFIGWNTKANKKGKTYQPGQQFRITGDTVLYAMWEKIPEKKPDKPKPDKPKPDKPKPDKPKPDKPEPDKPKPDKPGGGAKAKTTALSSNANSAGKKNNGKAKKDSKYFFEPERSYTLNKDSLVFGSENEVPRGSEPYKGMYVGSGGRGLSGALANIWNCMIHWIILLGILLTVLYDILRRLFIKRKDEYSEPSMLFDGLLPMLPLPLVFVLFFLRQCFLDFWMLMLWVLVAELGKYFLQRAYRKEEPASQRSDREAQ